MNTSAPRWYIRTSPLTERGWALIADLPIEAVVELEDSSELYFESISQAEACATLLGTAPPRLSAAGAGEVFGHTLHPTTQLCLDLIPSTIRPTDHVADIGSGTGRLAQAAEAYSPHIVAVDPDRPAAQATRTALRSSSLVVQGSAATLATASFDLILANLHLALWRSLAPEIARIAKPQSQLIASGFLEDQLPEVWSLLDKHGWSVNETRTTDRWLAVRAVQTTLAP